MKITQMLMDIKKELTRMQYKVIDNYLPKEQFEAIKNMMMNDASFPWFLSQNHLHETQLERNVYFFHLFYNEYVPRSQFLGSLTPLLEKLDAKAYIRIKGNLFASFGERMKDTAHKDLEYEHKGAIFYINTNNGPTVLDDGTEIEAIENRILFFEPHKYHSMTYCTDEKVRVNININYL